MTTFARKTFDVAGYLACRPTYPAEVYKAIYAYHGKTGKFNRALDLGCGPGFIALDMASHFDKVIGVDPSEKMVHSALQPKDTGKRIEYKVGNAEDLSSVVEDNSIDLVVAGQAAHWFDYPKVWRELSRIVRPGGTVAFVGYAEMLFPQHPQLNNLIATHSRGADHLGPYWQSGRRIIENMLDDVPFPIAPQPPSALRIASHNFTPSKILEPTLKSPTQIPQQGSWGEGTAVRLKEIDGRQWLMRKQFTRQALEGYLRTWSALHSYHEAHPEDKENNEGDIVNRLIGKIYSGLEQAGHGSDQVEIGWPLILMMIRKQT